MATLRNIFLLSIAAFAVIEADTQRSILTNFLNRPKDDFSNIIVFVNPKSGGNEGAKVLKKLANVMSSTQVFDLSQGGPKKGLELHKDVADLRILACGGDGTVGWILSVLDQMDFETQPSIAILPLGTGNDLSRTLGWGGGYQGEHLLSVLRNVAKSQPVSLDRWSLNVSPNPDEKTDGLLGETELPLNVMNNYLSLGLDAQIALDFHEARQKNPKRFQSQIGNKVAYGKLGAKELMKSQWRNLHKFVTVECDGVDITSKLERNQVSAVIFLNIPTYGGGTRPWSASDKDQSIDDEMFEVVGLSGLQLPALHMGGQGTRLGQCKTAKIVTIESMPMQVDGEPSMMKPSIIELSLLNKAPMLAKENQGLLHKLKNLKKD